MSEAIAFLMGLFLGALVAGTVVADYKNQRRCEEVAGVWHNGACFSKEVMK